MDFYYRIELLFPNQWSGLGNSFIYRLVLAGLSDNYSIQPICICQIHLPLELDLTFNTANIDL